MKNFHIPSLLLGVATGIIVLILFVSVSRVMGGTSSSGTSASQSGRSLDRMAQRFGMTTADLQKELSAGKTIQQIAQEHNVSFGGRPQSGSGANATGTGSWHGFTGSGSWRGRSSGTGSARYDRSSSSL